MKNIETNLGLLFDSEIDWGSWNPEIPENEALLNEYLTIEQTTKENGTWMKTPRNYKIFSIFDETNLESLTNKAQNNEIRQDQIPFVEKIVKTLEIAKEDSIIYQGTPEQFVQEHSENFKKAFPNPALTYRGGYGNWTNKGSLAQCETLDLGSIFTADKKSAIHYGTDKIIKGSLDTSVGLLELWYNEDNNSFEFSANGSGWDNIDIDNIPKLHSKKLKTLNGIRQYISTNELAKYIELMGINYIKIKNVFDGIEIPEEVIFNHKLGNYFKSKWFNNGMFDMSNPNIYK